MKSIVAALTILFSQITFALSPLDSQKESGKYELVPVSQVQVTTQTGCGQPNPNGEPCNIPDQTEVSFMVPWGGSCHIYKAEVTVLNGENFLNILDYTFEDCTRVEISNYKTSVPLDLPRAGSAVLKLANTLYIQEFFRP